MSPRWPLARDSRPWVHYYAAPPTLHAPRVCVYDTATTNGRASVAEIRTDAAAYDELDDGRRSGRMYAHLLRARRGQTLGIVGACGAQDLSSVHGGDRAVVREQERGVRDAQGRGGVGRHPHGARRHLQGARLPLRRPLHPAAHPRRGDAVLGARDCQPRQRPGALLLLLLFVSEHIRSLARSLTHSLTYLLMCVALSRSSIRDKWT